MQLKTSKSGKCLNANVFVYCVYSYRSTIHIYYRYIHMYKHIYIYIHMIINVDTFNHKSAEIQAAGLRSYNGRALSREHRRARYLAHLARLARIQDHCKDP